jgi:hypothetical protein
MLRKRKKPEDNKKAAATKENTKDISSFFTSKRLATTSSAAFHQTLPKYENNIASADFGALQHDEWQENAVGLSSNTLDEFARQTGFKEISPNDSASQVGDESSVAGSLAATQGLGEETTRKRDKKAQEKFEGATARSSATNRSGVGRYEAKLSVGDRTKSGAVVKEVFEDQWKFIKHDKKGNKFFTCLKCQKMAVRGDSRKLHACK